MIKLKLQLRIDLSLLLTSATTKRSLVVAIARGRFNLTLSVILS